MTACTTNKPSLSRLQERKETVKLRVAHLFINYTLRNKTRFYRQIINLWNQHVIKRKSISLWLMSQASAQGIDL